MRPALLIPLLLCAEAARAGRVLDILELRVSGVEHLTALEVETVLMPFLGPARPIEDIEKARLALEKAYSDKGYQSVAVAIPPQTVREGVVLLTASEGKVGRLRVRGAHWFLPSGIKNDAPSLAEGSLPNFNDIARDIATLNRLPDRRVTPALRAGVEPGTIDVDLNVQDRAPLHGSLELNNRYSPGTTHQRVTGTLRYDNLWQAGHSLSIAFQVAPARNQDGKVFSASYLARFADAPWLSVLATGLVQDSDISTLGGTAVIGRGRIFGGHATFTLPSSVGLFHTITAGVDYKHFGKEIEADPFALPIVYWPLSLQYAASFSSESWQAQAGATGVMGLRGLGSSDDAFDARRYKASASFAYLRFEGAGTQELPARLQLSGRMQGQYSGDPLVPSEQLTAGGAESVRGYLEAQAAGDLGLVASLELRSPSAARWLGSWVDELRAHVFVDGARVTLQDGLPEQNHIFVLLSTGAGCRARLFDHLSGSFDLGVPLRNLGATQRFHAHGHFRIQGEF